MSTQETTLRTPTASCAIETTPPSPAAPSAGKKNRFKLLADAPAFQPNTASLSPLAFGQAMPLAGVTVHTSPTGTETSKTECVRRYALASDAPAYRPSYGENEPTLSGSCSPLNEASASQPLRELETAVQVRSTPSAALVEATEHEMSLSAGAADTSVRSVALELFQSIQPQPDQVTQACAASPYISKAEPITAHRSEDLDSQASQIRPLIECAQHCHTLMMARFSHLACSPVGILMKACVKTRWTKASGDQQERLVDVSLLPKPLKLCKRPSLSRRTCYEDLNEEQIENLFKGAIGPVASSLKQWALQMIKRKENEGNYSTHRAFGHLVFYLQLLAYHQDYLVKGAQRHVKADLDITRLQFGVGSEKEQTQAAHHSMLANVRDNLFVGEALKRRLEDFHRDWLGCQSFNHVAEFIQAKEPLIMLLIQQGIPFSRLFEVMSQKKITQSDFVGNLLKSIQEARKEEGERLPQGYVSQKSLIYILSNMTYVADHQLNDVDGYFEEIMRYEDLDWLTRVADGMDPDVAFDRHIARFDQVADDGLAQLEQVRSTFSKLNELSTLLDQEIWQLQETSEPDEGLYQQFIGHQKAWLEVAYELIKALDKVKCLTCLNDPQVRVINAFQEELEQKVVKSTVVRESLLELSDRKDQILRFSSLLGEVTPRYKTTHHSLDPVLKQLTAIILLEKEGSEKAKEPLAAFREGYKVHEKERLHFLYAFFFSSARIRLELETRRAAS